MARSNSQKRKAKALAALQELTAAAAERNRFLQENAAVAAAVFRSGGRGGDTSTTTTNNSKKRKLSHNNNSNTNNLTNNNNKVVVQPQPHVVQLLLPHQMHPQRCLHQLMQLFQQQSSLAAAAAAAGSAKPPPPTTAADHPLVVRMIRTMQDLSQIMMMNRSTSTSRTDFYDNHTTTTPPPLLLWIRLGGAIKNRRTTAEIIRFCVQHRIPHMVQQQWSSSSAASRRSDCGEISSFQAIVRNNNIVVAGGATTSSAAAAAASPIINENNNNDDVIAMAMMTDDDSGSNNTQLHHHPQMALVQSQCIKHTLIQAGSGWHTTSTTSLQDLVRTDLQSRDQQQSPSFPPFHRDDDIINNSTTVLQPQPSLHQQQHAWMTNLNSIHAAIVAQAASSSDGGGGGGDSAVDSNNNTHHIATTTINQQQLLLVLLSLDKKSSSSNTNDDNDSNFTQRIEIAHLCLINQIPFYWIDTWSTDIEPLLTAPTSTVSVVAAAAFCRHNDTATASSGVVDLSSSLQRQEELHPSSTTSTTGTTVASTREFWLECIAQSKHCTASTAIYWPTLSPPPASKNLLDPHNNNIMNIDFIAGGGSTKTGGDDDNDDDDGRIIDLCSLSSGSTSSHVLQHDASKKRPREMMTQSSDNNHKGSVDENNRSGPVLESLIPSAVRAFSPEDARLLNDLSTTPPRLKGRIFRFLKKQVELANNSTKLASSSPPPQPPSYPMVIITSITPEIDCISVFQRALLVVFRTCCLDHTHTITMHDKCRSCIQYCIDNNIPHIVLGPDYTKTGSIQMLAGQIKHQGAQSRANARVNGLVAIALMESSHPINNNALDSRIRKFQSQCRAHSSLIAQAGGGWNDILQRFILEFYRRWRCPPAARSTTSSEHHRMMFLSMNCDELTKLVTGQPSSSLGENVVMCVLMNPNSRKLYRTLCEVAIQCRIRQTPFYFLEDWDDRIKTILSKADVMDASTNVAATIATVGNIVCLVHNRSFSTADDMYQRELGTLRNWIARSKSQYGWHPPAPPTLPPLAGVPVTETDEDVAMPNGLYDSEQVVAGLDRSFLLENLQFDMDPHILNFFRRHVVDFPSSFQLLVVASPSAEIATEIQRSRVVLIRSCSYSGTDMHKKCLETVQHCIANNIPHLLQCTIESVVSLQIIAAELANEDYDLGARHPTVVAVALVGECPEAEILLKYQQQCRAHNAITRRSGGGWSDALQQSIVHFCQRWNRTSDNRRKQNVGRVSFDPGHVLRMIHGHQDQKAGTILFVLLNPYKKANGRRRRELTFACWEHRVPFYFPIDWAARLCSLLADLGRSVSSAMGIPDIVGFYYDNNFLTEDSSFETDVSALIDKLASSKPSNWCHRSPISSQLALLLPSVDDSTDVDARNPGSESNEEDGSMDELLASINTSMASSGAEVYHVIGQSTSLDDLENNESSVGLIKLEEEITLLESAIEQINCRRKEADRELDQAQAAATHWMKQEEYWRSRSEQLLQRQSKQHSLQQRLKVSISQSMSRLERLKSSDVTVEEIKQISESQQDEERKLDACTNDEAPDKAELFSLYSDIDTFPTNTNSEDHSLVSLPSRASSPNLQNQVDNSLGNSFFPTEHETVELNIPQIDRIWDVRRDKAVAQYRFLSCCPSEVLLKAILDVEVLETLLLDSLDAGGECRRFSMLKTCVDACLMANMEPTEKRPATVARDEQPKRIDPNVSLCPFELAGECADPNCPYQHLNERKSGAVLPRVFLPLPKLRLGEDYPKTVVRQTLEKGSEQVPTVDSAEIIGADYVELPTNVQLPTSSTETMAGALECTSPCLNRQDFWWMDSAGLSSTEWTTKQPILEIMSYYGLHVKPTMHQTATMTLHGWAESCSIQDSCRYASMLIDNSRLAVHSGRFDVCNGIVEASAQTLAKHKNLGENDEPHPICPVFSSLCISVLETAASRSYTFDSCAESNCFRVALDSQAEMALASFCFHQAFMHLESLEEPSGAALDGWSALSLIDQNVVPFSGPTEGIIGLAKAASRVCSSESDTREVSLAAVAETLKFINSVRALSIAVANNITSVKVLLGDILHPTIQSVRATLQTALSNDEISRREMLKGVLFASYIVLGSLESASNQVSMMHEESAELRELCGVVDHFLAEVRDLSSSFWTMDCLLVPVYAANAALYVSLGLYGDAYSRLERILGSLTIGRDGFAPYSELLWSQIIQLRMSLPTRLTDSTLSPDSANIKYSLPSETEASNAALCKMVTTLGVFPRHISLRNDWNVVNILRESGIYAQSDVSHMEQLDGGKPLAFLRSSRALHQVLTGQTTTSNLKFSFGNEKLLVRGAGDASPGFRSIYSTVPHCLLLAGASMIELDLSGTDLHCLPLHFGQHFPNLQNLDLSMNALQVLPESIQLLVSLRELDLSDNQIVHLPASFALGSLKVLSARNNRLTDVPATVVGCTQLERIDLSGNTTLSAQFWSIISQLPKLRELKPQQMSQT